MLQNLVATTRIHYMLQINRLASAVSYGSQKRSHHKKIIGPRTPFYAVLR